MTKPGLPPFSFRGVGSPADLGLARRWLHEPHVQPWWKPGDLDDMEGVEPWFLLLDHEPAGYFQTLAIADDPEYLAICASVGIGADTGGLDYFLARPELLGRGIGTASIRAFTIEVVFGGHPQWQMACAGPHPDNRSSLRALEKVGFVLAGLVDTAEGPEAMMAIDRERALRATGTGRP